MLLTARAQSGSSVAGPHRPRVNPALAAAHVACTRASLMCKQLAYQNTCATPNPDIARCCCFLLQVA